VLLEDVKVLGDKGIVSIMGCRPWRKLSPELLGKSHPICPCVDRCVHDLSFLQQGYFSCLTRASRHTGYI
jgi:hypothetical protein